MKWLAESHGIAIVGLPIPWALTFRITVSAAVLAASLFIILSNRYGPKDKHWAYATVGTVLGYWLKP